MSDELYRLPLDEFTAARDALAARLRAKGDKNAAAGVVRARKPSVPAWAANQVVWHAAHDWERLREAVRALRRMHETNGSAAVLREAVREQREAVQACETRAAALLAGAGHAASPAVLEKVGHTLLALAHGSADAVPGRLDRELPPPGFEVLAGLTLAAAPARTPAESLKKQEEERPSAALHTPEAGDAVEARSRAEAAARDRAAALAAAEARAAETGRFARESREALLAAERRLGELEAELGSARRAREEAGRRSREAEGEHAQAEAALRALRARS